MYSKDRVYRLGFKERVKVYEYKDIVENEKVDLFQGNKEWPGTAINYSYYLHRGRNRKIGSDYRVVKKKALVRKIIKLFFKMMMEDILNGEKVRIGTRAFYLFIGIRDPKSPLYNFILSQQGIDYIPYVKLSKKLTSGYAYNMMFMVLADKYKIRLKQLLKSGKKYKML